MEAISFGPAGGAVGDFERKPAQAKGENVSEHMGRVADKGQTVGKDAAHSFHHQDQKRQRDGKGQPFSGRVRVHILSFHKAEKSHLLALEVSILF